MYVYPKLSNYDLLGIRLGGAGLGNILFPYSEALVFSKKYNCKMIFPSWPSLKIGPIIRR